MKQIARISIAVVIVLLSAINMFAQEQPGTPPVLPEFQALIKTGKIQLDWISGFRDVRQIGIQRSLDSVLNFYTIGYANTPNESRNTYLDNKPLPGTNYYRLFILFNNGRFFFSKTVLAVTDSTIMANQRLEYADVKDASRAMRGKEQENKAIAWYPSNYVYTTADGNVNIRLPEAPQKKYSIKFYESNGTFLFDIEQVKAPFLILEKAIFLHAGWFNFELFEEGKLKEKWSLFIPLIYTK